MTMDLALCGLVLTCSRWLMSINASVRLPPDEWEARSTGGPGFFDLGTRRVIYLLLADILRVAAYTEGDKE